MNPELANALDLVVEIVYNQNRESRRILISDLMYHVARAQREADFTHFDKGDKYPRLNDVPLVVPSTEHSV